MRHLALLLILLPGLALAQSRPQSRPMTVAVYPGATEGLWAKVAAAYTAATGRPMRVFAPALPAAAVAQAAGKPTFDAALIASYAVPGLLDKGLLQPLTPDQAKSIHTVPEAYWPRSPDKTLMGVPIYFSLYGIAYNTELAKASDFASWNNLLDAKWRGQVPLNRPTMLAAYDLTLFSKLNGGDETNVEPGYRFIEKLAAHAHSVYSSMAAFESQLARGEVVAAPFYSAEMTLQKRLGAPSLGFTVPKEGGLMLSYLLVVPKGAAMPEEALHFMDWMLQPEAQLMLAHGAGVWPMNSQVTLPPDLAKELGGNVTEVMARNVYPDWYIVGRDLTARTRKIEALIQSAK